MDADLQQELIADFVLQSTEELDAFDRELLVLEKREGGAETLRTIFRVIHTIKGTAGCIGLGQIERLAHSAENVLARVQKGTLDPTADVISVLLKARDGLGEMVRRVERTGVDDGFEIGALVFALDEIQAGRQTVPLAAPAAFGFFDDEPVEARAPDEPGAASEATLEPESLFGIFADEDAEPVASLPAPVAPVAPVAPPATVAAAASTAPKGGISTAANAESAKPSIADNVVRVDVAQLDTLMNLVGELVLTRNQILAASGIAEHATLGAAAQRLNVITSELQERVMKTRMQPIGNVMAKFPRTVRDLASDLSKRVRLIMDGQATELDRTILDAIRDPLTHIVRNAIDHGLEVPAERRSVGKPEEGTLAIRAYHEGGQVIIEIMDDGRGIDVERVKAKAVSNGLIDTDRAARMTEREVLQLIFLPGFSTAEQVTNVSGRGVGMDVVRANVERTGGSIDIQTERGQGTTMRLKIPLTLAIIPALTVTAADERFAIPQMSLVELVRLERGTSTTAIELLGGSPVYRLRGRLLPVASLSALLKLRSEKPEALLAAEVTNIVVLQADGQEFGLVVDAVNDTEEIVVKPLSKHLKSVNVYAGATIMGDGRVALILDATGLAQRASVSSQSRERLRMADTSAVDARTDGAAQELLLCRAAGDRRLAIPLHQVRRLEEVPVERVERAGTRRVLQYRGQLLPLVEVSETFGQRASERRGGDTIRIIVASVDGHDIGLIVDRIEDIVSEVIDVRYGTTAAGISGSAVVAGHVTDLLDVAAAARGHVLTLANAA